MVNMDKQDEQDFLMVHILSILYIHVKHKGGKRRIA